MSDVKCLVYFAGETGVSVTTECYNYCTESLYNYYRTSLNIAYMSDNTDPMEKHTFRKAMAHLLK